MTSGQCQETSYAAITLNLESNFTRREKNHSLFQNYSYELGGLARKPHRRLLEYRWIKRFVWFVDRFHQTGVCGPGRDSQKGKWHPGQVIYGQNSGRNRQEMLSWGRSRNGQLKNQSSTMLEDYGESISLTPRTRSSKKPVDSRQKLETPMAPAMPCKTSKKNKHGETRGETRGETNDFKSKFACILEASESTRLRISQK